MHYLIGPAHGRPKNNDGPAQPGPKMKKNEGPAHGRPLRNGRRPGRYLPGPFISLIRTILVFLS